MKKFNNFDYDSWSSSDDDWKTAKTSKYPFYNNNNIFTDDSDDLSGENVLNEDLFSPDAKIMNQINENGNAEQKQPLNNDDRSNLYSKVDKNETVTFASPISFDNQTIKYSAAAAAKSPNYRNSVQDIIPAIVKEENKNQPQDDQTKKIDPTIKPNIEFLTSEQPQKKHEHDVRATLNQFLIDESYCFHLFKSKKEKINLLNESVKSNDGNAILATIIFLKQTLAPHLFYDIIAANQTALRQYEFYLKQINDEKELEKFHKYDFDGECIKSFKHILCDSQMGLQTKSNILSNIETQYQENELSNGKIYFQVAKNHLRLLKTQLEIVMKNKDSFLSKDEQKQNAMGLLTNSTVLYTVLFCLKYKLDLQKSEHYDIEYLKKSFNINSKEFAILNIIAMSEMGYWTELERFTQAKSILNVQMRPKIPQMTIFFIVLNAKAPIQQLRQYISLVEDVNERKRLASKLNLVDMVIEIFKRERDRTGLVNYRDQFKQHSSEFVQCNVALNEKIKWKN